MFTVGDSVRLLGGADSVVAFLRLVFPKNAPPGGRQVTRHLAIILALAWAALLFCVRGVG
jgi:hypothetical protein